MPETLSVFYDADCGFCAWTARVLRSLDRGRRLRLIPLATVALPCQPSPDTLLEALHAVDSKGRWRVGADACLEIAERLPVLRPLARLAAVPLFRPLADVGYRLVARNRHRLSALLGLDACQPAVVADDGGQPR